MDLSIYSDAPTYNGGSNITKYSVQMKGAVEEGKLSRLLNRTHLY